jgi:hypothetical protein
MIKYEVIDIIDPRTIEIEEKVSLNTLLLIWQRGVMRLATTTEYTPGGVQIELESQSPDILPLADEEKIYVLHF